MASACVKISPESFLDRSPVKCPPCGWLVPQPPSAAGSNNADPSEQIFSDPETSGNGFIDFEFRLVDPVRMLPADELFSDGKLVPLHLSAIRRSTEPNHPAPSDLGSERASEIRNRKEISPKAPRCASGWKEILGLKKLYQHNNNNGNQCNSRATRSIKQFLHRGSNAKSASIDSSLNHPLLKESDNNNNESLSISSRLSLSSSSSSGHDYDELPRLSLDSDYKPNKHTTNMSHLSRVRVIKHGSTENRSQTASFRDGRSPIRRSHESRVQMRGVSVDSPRMNPSGKIVFYGLERSSSSPSTFNGGPKSYKSRAMERSYSTNVRVAPVLNVPVFGLFSSQQKRDGGNSGGASKVQQKPNRTEPNRSHLRD